MELRLLDPALVQRLPGLLHVPVNPDALPVRLQRRDLPGHFAASRVVRETLDEAFVERQGLAFGLRHARRARPLHFGEGGFHRRGDVGARRQRYQVHGGEQPVQQRVPSPDAVLGHQRLGLFQLVPAQAGADQPLRGARRGLGQGFLLRVAVSLPVGQVAVVQLPYVVGQSARVAAAGDPFVVLALEVAHVSAEPLGAMGQGVDDGRARALLQLVGEVALGRGRRLEGIEVAQGVQHPLVRRPGRLRQRGSRQHQEQAEQQRTGLHRLSLLVRSMSPFSPSSFAPASIFSSAPSC